MCACADCAAKEIQARVLRNYLSVKTAGQSVNMVIVSVTDFYQRWKCIPAANPMYRPLKVPQS